MRLTDFIIESINDKGILKAVFFTGQAGSGKTRLMGKIKDGALPIIKLTTDTWTEYFNDKGHMDWEDYGAKAKSLTVVEILNKVNGLFPAFIETTGGDIVRFKKRVDFLRDIGYDVSLIVIDTSLEQSLMSVARRNNTQSRKLGNDQVVQIYKEFSKSMSSFKSVIPDHIIINNEGYPKENAEKAYKIVMNRLNSPVKNEKGKKLLDFMRKNSYKYYNDIPLEWRQENGYPDLDKDTIKWFKH
jgi:hypothetical protein